LKLTTDRHEASRGLFATAELLVFRISTQIMCAKFRENQRKAVYRGVAIWKKV